MENLVLDNIVFDLQRFGGISVVWYELLSRLQHQDDLQLSFFDNDGSDNDCRRNLLIDREKVVARNVCPSVMRYMTVRYKKKGPFLFHSSYFSFSISEEALCSIRQLEMSVFRSLQSLLFHCQIGKHRC